MGVTFSGRYTWKHIALFQGSVLDEIDLQRLYSIVGQYFEPMMNRFQGLSEGENNDTFVARVTIGGVRGLYRWPFLAMASYPAHLPGANPRDCKRLLVVLSAWRHALTRLAMENRPAMPAHLRRQGASRDAPFDARPCRTASSWRPHWWRSPPTRAAARCDNWPALKSQTPVD
jgi:hypothetical protein